MHGINMKRVFVLLLMFSMMFALVVAQEAPDIGIGGTDVEDIQGIVDDYSPIDEEGEIDIEKYKPYKSKAEERIDNINLWLEENASWLSAVFGMVPALSVLFAINLYLILLYLVILVFNGDVLALWFSVLDNKIDLMFFETRWSNVVGFIFFIGLIATKALVLLAEFLEELFWIFWDYILPWGLAIAIILTILVVVLGGFIIIKFLPQILQALGQAMKKRKEQKAQKKQEANREVLEKVVKGVTGE